MNNNFMYGIGEVRYRGTKIGYIAKNSFDLGGVKPEAAEIEAEQVPGSPVLVIAQSNGKIGPKFDMIQLSFESLQQLLGGRLLKNNDKEITGWTAPRSAMVMEGPWELKLVSGQSILIPNATLLSDLAGKLTLTETAKIEVELKVAMPTEEGVPPYGVFDSNALPDEWTTGSKYSLPKETADETAGVEQQDAGVQQQNAPDNESQEGA